MVLPADLLAPLRTAWRSGNSFSAGRGDRYGSEPLLTPCHRPQSHACSTAQGSARTWLPHRRSGNSRRGPCGDVAVAPTPKPRPTAPPISWATFTPQLSESSEYFLSQGQEGTVASPPGAGTEQRLGGPVMEKQGEIGSPVPESSRRKAVTAKCSSGSDVRTRGCQEPSPGALGWVRTGTRPRSPGASCAPEAAQRSGRLLSRPPSRTPPSRAARGLLCIPSADEGRLSPHQTHLQTE